jgi:hypothetical protein
MKQAFFIIAMLLSAMPVALPQGRVVPNKPFSTLSSNPGFVTINELTGGLGLVGKSYPYSKHFFGFSSVNGYQVTSNFFLGAGLGISFYDAGVLVPLFLDIRYAFSTGQLSPYLYADGGLQLNVSNFNETKLFINPGVGARYALSRKLAVNISGGILSQVDGINRASFANFKLGVIYKFK